MAYLNAVPQSVRKENTSTAGPEKLPAGDTTKKQEASVSMSYQLGFAPAA
ncbi:hypothetical protein [Tropicimonas sp. S265A]